MRLSHGELENARATDPIAVDFGAAGATPSRASSSGCVPPVDSDVKTNWLFYHRVVALVAGKLERQWSWEICFGVED